MPTFKDTKDREWNLLIDGLLIEQIRDHGDPEFLKGEPTETTSRIDDDPVLLCGVIWILCKEQATARGIDQKEFYTGVVAHALESASRALTDAIQSFIPPRQRELLAVGAARNEKFREIAARKGMAVLNDPNLEAEMEAFVDAKLAELLTPLKSVGNTPASSVSTPKD